MRGRKSKGMRVKIGEKQVRVKEVERRIKRKRRNVIKR